MIKGIACAPSWFEALSTGRVRSFREIAESEGVSEQYVSMPMPLASLALDIVERILGGTHVRVPDE
jgi:hypothetical protein